MNISIEKLYEPTFWVDVHVQNDSNSKWIYFGVAWFFFQFHSIRLKWKITNERLIEHASLNYVVECLSKRDLIEFQFAPKIRFNMLRISSNVSHSLHLAVIPNDFDQIEISSSVHVTNA